MRRIHKFLSVFLAIIMVLSIVPITASAAVYSGTCGDNLTWTYDSTTYTLNISGTGDMDGYGYSNRPWETYEDKIKTVIIADGVTSIGAYAFYSFGKVTSITIPDSVTEIGKTAFNACSVLTTIQLPEGITVIPDRLFTNCKTLASVNIPSTVTSIGASAFEGCSSLTSIVIPEGVTTIGDKAFASCKGLTRITIPASVTAIDFSAFDNCTNLVNIIVDSNNPNYSSDEYGVLFNQDKTILISYTVGSTITSYTIPDGVKTIGTYAFNGCTKLTEVIIPESVVTIDEYAFYGCSALQNIIFKGENSSLMTIGKNAFANCSNLAEITMPASIMIVGSNVFAGTPLYNNDENWINDILYIGNCLIVAKSTISGDIQIKDGTKVIAERAFYGCTNITSVVIPEGVTTIGVDAFSYCSKLENITIPVSVKTIKDGAFDGCTSLKEVYYSGKAKDWNSILIREKNEPLINADLLSGPGGEVIVIPGGYVGNIKWFFDEESGLLKISGQGDIGDYENGSRPWEKYAQDVKKVIIEEGITKVGKYAFYGFKNLTSVTLPDTIKSIGDYAFNGCSSLTSIKLGESTTSIGYAAFANCMNVTSVTFGKALETIGKWAFDECYSIEKFTVNSDNLFFSCDEFGVLFNKDKTSLIMYPLGNSRTSYTMPDSVTTIKSKSFDDCKNLITLTFSKNLRTIEENVFSSCSIKEYYYPCTVEQWNDEVTVGDQNNMITSKTLHFAPTNFEAVTGKCGENLIWTLNAFTGEMVISGTGEMYNYEYKEKRSWEDYTSVIKTVVFADGVTTVGKETFAYCTRITSVTFSNTVTSIGDYAFYECISIESLTIPDSVTTIGTAAFLGCENVVEITIGKGFTSFAANTFLYFEKLERITVDSENPNFSSNEDGVLFNRDKTTIVKYPEGHSRTSYTIPDSVTTIGVYAFHGCENLTQIMVPEGVTKLELGAFTACPGIETVVLPNTLTTIGDKAFSYCDNLTEVVIPGSVTTIGKEAFKYCIKLENVTIPDGVTSIGLHTFYYCEKLTDVVIPAGVTSIGKEAFYECSYLEDVYFKGTRTQWSNITIANYNEPLYDATIYFNYGSGEFLYTVISEEEKTIEITGYNISAPSIKVIIPRTIDGYTVVKIGDKAFYNIDASLSVNIPDTVTAIGNEAFYDCDNITNITIPESVVSIGENAFTSCDNLTKLEMGKGVITIDDGAFNKCANLKDIYYTGTEEKWNSITIGENNQPLLNATRHFEYSEMESVSGICGENLTWTLDFYSERLTISGTGEMKEYGYQKFPWESYKDSISEVVISEGVTTIGTQAFDSCTNLEIATIAGSVTTIGNSAFRGCTSLNSIVIPDSVTTIGSAVFYNCKNLTEAKLSKNITKIDSQLFYGCNKLKAITIPEGVISIGDEAFYTCVSLTEITIPESVTKIYEEAFAYCKGLTTITIGLGVERIGSGAFYYCISLQDVYYTGSPSQWKMILISTNNNELLDATLHCLSEEHPHEFVIVVTEPGCLTRGYTTYTCECGYTYTDNYVDVLEHDFENVVTNPTCTEEGYTTCTCTRCGYSYIGAYRIDPIGHNLISQVATPSTHLTEGIEILTCDVCGYTETWSIEKTPEHTYEATVTEPTCTAEGFTIYTCACGDSYVDDYVPVAAHTVEQFEGIISEPSCSSDGSKEIISCCTVCNAGLGSEIVTIPALSHTPTDAIEENYVASTCTETGSVDKVVYCSECDEEISRETEILDATGHADNNGDGYCDADNELLDPTVECDHNCHKGGITGFLWKIGNLFNKLFGTNKYCECGIAHY